MFNDRLLLNQVKYSIDLLKHAQMAGCKSISTPMMSELQPPADGDGLFPDPHLFHSIVGGLLQYMTYTRPDICVSVNYVLLYNICTIPLTSTFSLSNAYSIMSTGLLTMGFISFLGILSCYQVFLMQSGPVAALLSQSIKGYRTLLGGNYISWSTKKQPTVSLQYQG